MRRGLVLFGALLAFFHASACLLIADLPEPADSTTGSGGAGGGGASTGTGGVAGAGGQAGAGVPARDWTSTLGGPVYLFEQPPPSLGLDASGNGLDLVEVDGPTQETGSAPEGSGALLTSALTESRLESDANGFDSAPGSSFTWGGWFRADDHPVTNDMEAVAKTGGSGYALYRTVDGGAGCIIGDGNWTRARSSSGIWSLGDWVHVVCRFDIAADDIAGFFDGVHALTGDKNDVTTGARPFGMPTSESGWGFTGAMDEVFFTRQVVSDAAIRRIRACGIDGTKCRCSTEIAADYIDCGLPDCDALPPCDQAAP